MAKYDLDLRMGVDDKLVDADVDVGALSYSVDKQNLYIDALKEDKVTIERQMVNADKAYAIRDRDEDIVAESSVGKYSFRENEKTIALGNSSHAEGLGRKAQAYITGSAGSTSYTYEFINGGDFNQSDGHMSVASMDSINTPLVWVYKDNKNNCTYATGSDFSHNSKGTITLSNTLSENAALNRVIVDVYSGGYALGNNSHAEGMYSKTLSENSHAEGVHTRTTGIGAHAEGYRTTAKGNYSHAEGCFAEANGDYSHAENYGRAEGKASHSEGFTDSSIIGDGSWYLGGAEGDYSHNEGYQTLAQGKFSHSEGYYSWATAWGAHAEGTRTEASGSDSHAEGYQTFASGNDSHAEGAFTISEGKRSHSEGFNTVALGDYSHAEGIGDRKILYITGEANTVNYTISNDYYNEFDEIQINDIVFFSINKIDLSDGNSPSYATKTKNIIAKILSIDYENKIITLDKTLSTNDNILEDDEIYVYTSYAKGKSSHVEGEGTIALGISSHAEGRYAQAIGQASHAEGSKTIASGDNSHSSGLGTIASGKASSSFGQYNKPKNDDEEDYLFTIGNGDNDSSRSNVLALRSDSIELNENTVINAELTVNKDTTFWGGVNFQNLPTYTYTDENDTPKTDSLVYESQMDKAIEDAIAKNNENSSGSGTSVAVGGSSATSQIWQAGNEPPEDTRLLWIRTGSEMGNGIIYYYGNRKYSVGTTELSLNKTFGQHTVEYANSLTIIGGALHLVNPTILYIQESEADSYTSLLKDKYVMLLNTGTSYDGQIIQVTHTLVKTNSPNKLEIRGKEVILDNTENNWFPISSIYT